MFKQPSNEVMKKFFAACALHGLDITGNDEVFDSIIKIFTYILEKLPIGDTDV